MANPGNPPIFIKLWGSSHGTPRHHLPQVLNEFMDGYVRFHRPVYDAVGGRKLNHDVVTTIERDMSSRFEKQVHILFLGGNNLRKKGDPEHLILYFRAILEHAYAIPGCFVVLVSLLPSPKTDHISKKRFEMASSMLKKLSFEFEETCSFLNISRVFLKEVTFEGRKKHSINRLYYKPDGIHMNCIGAGRVAQMICDHVNSIPNKCLII